MKKCVRIILKDKEGEDQKEYDTKYNPTITEVMKKNVEDEQG